ncbi:50S ribosomal protein L17 [Candidatus Berkelbacteria bacterium RIFCSPHIGHO2_12_FULL_36_9]|uniref:50S ribosomal protein L17 n=1 Tax=Candidatus Berkelbacteria bacterium RIFCSPHIGHO2_12_FULL_36_9 TaxID=1797469 RepID=A0A1F5EKZ8_9BACT|nr:MAG: 50S ribosomal protein L17 [Candidatus Berkelbacteria bacterium RIFCSPHIGHO2_12_FULL_36_9]
MRKLGRKSDHRLSLYKNLVTSIILYERIQTTLPKAKSVRGLVEKVINLGKKGDLNSRRKLLGFLTDKNAVKKIFEVIALRYKEKNSGYIRIYRLGKRVGDGADKVILELINTRSQNEKQEDKEKQSDNENKPKIEEDANKKKG